MIKAGAEANITVIDPRFKLPVNVGEFVSLGKNSPFDGWVLRGWPVMTIVSGEIKYSRQL